MLHKALLFQTKRLSSRHLFSWILKVKMWLPQEQRHKSGEFVMTRLDTASVLAYVRASSLREHQVVLVREFRSAAHTCDGYVWELPGGSSFDASDPGVHLAAEELEEETSVALPVERFVPHGARQTSATLLTHMAHLFSVALTQDELDAIKALAGQVFGAHASERTTVHVLSVGQLLDADDVDWTQLGMILSVLTSLEDV